MSSVVRDIMHLTYVIWGVAHVVASIWARGTPSRSRATCVDGLAAGDDGNCYPTVPEVGGVVSYIAPQDAYDTIATDTSSSSDTWTAEDTVTVITTTSVFTTTTSDITVTSTTTYTTTVASETIDVPTGVTTVTTTEDEVFTTMVSYIHNLSLVDFRYYVLLDSRI